MSDNILTFEAYPSNTKVPDLVFHKYKFVTFKNEEPVKAIRSAVYSIKRKNNCFVYENGIFIFSVDKMDIPQTQDYKTQYLGTEVLPVNENCKIYQNYILDLIKEKLSEVKILSNKYKKYSCKGNISCGWFEKNNKFGVVQNSGKEIGLRRVFDIRIEIGNDGKANLIIHTKCEYSSKYTIADYLEQGKNIKGLQVKNTWSDNKQTGEIISFGEKTVSEPQSETMGSLKEHYCGRNQKSLVDKYPDDTPAIRVKLYNGKILSYYPQALKPVYTRDYVSKIDPYFSKITDRYMRMSMKERVEIDRDFIMDIGNIDALGDFSFETEYSHPETLSYKQCFIEPAKMICADNNAISYNQPYKVFNYGFFQSNPEPIKIGYLYPKGFKQYMAEVAIALYHFARNGKFHEAKDKYICKRLLNIEKSNAGEEEYETGSQIDYKRAAQKLANNKDINMIISIVPDEEEDNPYSPFKTVLAQHRIPSQMISEKTAKLFYDEKENGGTNTRNYMFNIILGILGKAGGVPWTIDNIPGNIDLFVGLDIATQEAKIHFPACSVVFDRQGQLLGYYKPKNAQRGEKMDEAMLEEIFSEVVLSYEDKYGCKPENIVIHRDGFSNESDEWYEKFFGREGIQYNIIEVRKYADRKLLYSKNGNIENPCIGSCLLSEEKQKAYLITTDIQKNGSPDHIVIEKKCGNLDLMDAVKQVLYLSQLNAAMRKSRLPVTTYYADRICKNREWVPEGKFSNSLFFL